MFFLPAPVDASLCWQSCLDQGIRYLHPSIRITVRMPVDHMLRTELRLHMHYSPDEFLRLADAPQFDQGGCGKPQVCRVVRGLSGRELSPVRGFFIVAIGVMG